MDYSDLTPAREIRSGKILYEYRPTNGQVISGFFIQLYNGIGPRDEPIIVGIQINQKKMHVTLRIPIFPSPLNMYTRQNRKGTVPLDIASRYHVALTPPYICQSAELIQLVILSCGDVASGIVGGLQFEGKWDLISLDSPFRENRGGGPITRIEWGTAEKIVSGNQIQFDPLCAPQNNSGIISDDDGTLFQITSYYSVDEQYGGGRKGSIARLYAFRKLPRHSDWEPLGCLVEPQEYHLVYAGDPFVFRDLDGTPCIAFTTADGTDGFADVQHVGGMLLRSKTRSFNGPWEHSAALFQDYPLGSNKEARVICLRIFPRATSHDYVIIWQYGLRDISIRGAIRSSLKIPLTIQEINSAPILVRNQEEGGGGFSRGNKGYISTWQIPSINDPTGLQRVYEFELADPLNPESWRPLPESWGWNAVSDPWQDGAETADAWSLSLDPKTDRLYSTAVVYSVTHHKNSIFTRSVVWAERIGAEYRFGAPKVKGFQNVSPAIEYALGSMATLDFEICSVLPGNPLYGLLGNSNKLLGGMVGLEISPVQIRFISVSKTGQIKSQRKSIQKTTDCSQFVHIRITKESNHIKAWINDVYLGEQWFPPWIYGGFRPELRFRLFAQNGAEYRVRNLVLTDGKFS